MPGNETVPISLSSWSHHSGWKSLLLLNGGGGETQQPPALAQDVSSPKPPLVKPKRFSEKGQSLTFWQPCHSLTGNLLSFCLQNRDGGPQPSTYAEWSVFGVNCLFFKKEILKTNLVNLPVCAIAYHFHQLKNPSRILHNKGRGRRRGKKKRERGQTGIIFFKKSLLAQCLPKIQSREDVWQCSCCTLFFNAHANTCKQRKAA